MRNPRLICDGDGCPADPAVRTCLRRLAQRGAHLRQVDLRAAVYVTRDAAEEAVAWVNADVVPALASEGWLTPCEPDGFVLSPLGAAVVRLIKAAPAPAAGGKGSLPPPAQQRAGGPAADADCALAWLRARRHTDGTPYLSQAAYEAGLRLREDFHQAGMEPRVTVDWSAIPRSRDESRGSVGGASRVRETTAAAGERVRRAHAALAPELAGIVMDICCYSRRLQDAERLHGMPRRTGHYILGIALTILARHYGMIPPSATPHPMARSVRHWGTVDYKPVA
jgi:Domain of unknown function (DUF6456)